jgi:hypothetical protein
MGTSVDDLLQTVDTEWLAFPGGELEGKAPRALCPDCRRRFARGSEERANRPPSGRRPLCFQCYRVGMERARAIQAAGERETASEARFQESLPFEPVNTVRLDVLKIERRSARVASRVGVGRFADRRRQAQIAARHALQQVGLDLNRRQATASFTDADRRREAAAIHAMELQLPAAWLPFVVAR